MSDTTNKPSPAEKRAGLQRDLREHLEKLKTGLQAVKEKGTPKEHLADLEKTLAETAALASKLETDE